MADLRVERGEEKRARLVTGARDVLHRNGVEKTTLADIAQASDIQLGTVYYHFKTKDDLVQAAVDAHIADMRGMLTSFERHRTPKARLKALLHALASQRLVLADHGCPHGSLCSELDKRGDALSQHAAQLIQLPIDWSERQFRELGRRDARDLAVAFLASYHGIALITNTLRDPDLMTREARRLERWIESLSHQAD
jgi:TetR/AcrR family transcriptional regulator, transcriptional repressor for nem operon